MTFDYSISQRRILSETINIRYVSHHIIGPQSISCIKVSTPRPKLIRKKEVALETKSPYLFLNFGQQNIFCRLRKIATDMIPNTMAQMVVFISVGGLEI